MTRLGLFTLFIALFLPLTQAANDDRDVVYQKYLDFGSMVEGGQFTPGWILAGPEFWYAEGGPQDRIIYLSLIHI